MANSTITTSLVTRYAVKEFLNAMVLCKAVDRQVDSQFRKVGDTVTVRRPVYFEATSGATLSTADDVIEGSVAVQLDQRQKVHFEFSSQELTLDIEEFNERYIKPAMQELVQKVESDIAGEYKNIYNFVGTPGTKPSSFTNVGEASATLNLLGVPTESMDRKAFYGPLEMIQISNGLTTVFPNKIATSAIERASIGAYAGFGDIVECQSLKSHTVGALGGTPLVDGAAQNVTYLASKDTYTQTLNIDGMGASVTDYFLAGDVITIAGVNSVNRRTREDTGELQTFVVTADATSGAGGDAAITISPPIITSGAYQTVTAAPADNAAITVKTGTAGTSYKQNLAFHKDAITLAMAPLDLPTAGAEASRETMDGISIRAVAQYDVTNDKNVYRFDILYGTVTQNPGFAVRTTS